MDSTQMTQQQIMQQSQQEQCKECNGLFFVDRLMIRRISKLLTGAPLDTIIPIQVIVCADCNTPLEDTIPRLIETNPTPTPNEGKIIKF